MSTAVDQTPTELRTETVRPVTSDGQTGANRPPQASIELVDGQCVRLGVDPSYRQVMVALAEGTPPVANALATMTARDALALAAALAMCAEYINQLGEQPVGGVQ